MAVPIVKTCIFLAIGGGVATFAVPMFAERQKRAELRVQFEPALKQLGKLQIGGDGKTGKLKHDANMTSLSRSGLPVIPGGVFIMTPGKRIERGNNWEDVPPRFHDSFFELSDSLRATSPTTIRTLVHAIPAVLTDHYTRQFGNAPTKRLTQKVIRVQIIDLQKQITLGSWVLEGETPPDSFRSDNVPTMAPPPSVALFLEACPRN